MVPQEVTCSSCESHTGIELPFCIVVAAPSARNVYPSCTHLTPFIQPVLGWYLRNLILPQKASSALPLPHVALALVVGLSPCSLHCSPRPVQEVLPRPGVREPLLCSQQLGAVPVLKCPVPSGTGSWTLLKCTPAGPTLGTQLCTMPLRSTSTAW